jgi:hypothetical protein
MNYTSNASYSATTCQYHLGKKENFTVKLSLPDNLIARSAELATGIVVLGTIGLWLFAV